MLNMWNIQHVQVVVTDCYAVEDVQENVSLHGSFTDRNLISITSKIEIQKGTSYGIN